MKTQRAESREQREKQPYYAFHPAPCPMPHAPCSIHSRGFTYLALLAAIIIIGITMTAASKYWQNIMIREKEEELLFRGDQYVKAIESYSKASGPGLVKRGPASIDDLLSDSRRMNKRHLRRKYKDPITGEDFVVMYGVTGGQTKQIIGVHSPSDKEPLKQSNFPKDSTRDYSSFEGKKKYSDWQFVTTQQGGQPGVPGTTIIIPQPGGQISGN